MSSYLTVGDYALLAPEATNNTWYPQSFLAPPAQNEPWLSSALSLVQETVFDINTAGISAENIYFMGFSQGACLMLEFVARNAKRYGGIVAFTGGLIGDKLYTDPYTGDFAGTSIFIGSSDPDPHVPVDRVLATITQLEKMNATVTGRIYKNMGHTITKEEIDEANNIVFFK